MHSQGEPTEIHIPVTQELGKTARLFAELLVEVILEKHAKRKKRKHADTAEPINHS